MPLFPKFVAFSDIELKRAATYASTGVALTLIVTKAFTFWLTDSMALLSSTVDSTMDLFASLVAAFGIARALVPPDRDHRFGHGKAEPLTSLAIAAFITGSAFLLIMQTLDRLGSPKPLENTREGYIVTFFALFLTSLLVLFQTYVIRRTGALTIKADRLHYTSDFMINLAVIASFALEEQTGIIWIDPVFALLIAVQLLKSAYDIAMQALGIMMDHELPEEEREKIKTIISSVPGLVGFHDLRTRSDSLKPFIEFHLEMPGTLTLEEAHKISQNVVKELLVSWPEADIFIHQDPAGLKENRLDQRLHA